MKKLMLLLVIVAAIVTVGCDRGSDEEIVIPDSFEGMTLSIITFTAEWETQGVIEDFEERTGATVDIQVVPNTDYEAKIRPLLATGQNVPDVFVGEEAYVRQFVEADYWLPLNQPPFSADVSDMFPYAAQMGTQDDGDVVALTWQTTPGGWFYRRSLAQEYFGTDDPDEVGALFADWDTALETAETLKQESGGTVRMFPGSGETIGRPFRAARTSPWIDDDNNFTVDPEMQEYMRIAKVIRDNDYDAKLDDWSGPWFEAMNAPAGEATVFTYGFPTWGLFFVIATQPDSYGDWGLAPAPAPYFWGGTWVGIYKDSPNKALAWEFVSMLTQDEEWMAQYSVSNGEFMSNISVMEEVKDDFTTDVLAGQNPFEFFFDQVQFIDASAVRGYDGQIATIFGQVLNEYLDDQMTYDEAIEEVGLRVKEALPRVNL